MLEKILIKIIQGSSLKEVIFHKVSGFHISIRSRCFETARIIYAPTLETSKSLKIL